jgi:hypothetical protein
VLRSSDRGGESLELEQARDQAVVVGDSIMCVVRPRLGLLPGHKGACMLRRQLRPRGDIGGPSQTIPCNGQVREGPLTPQRTYAVVVTVLLIRHGRTSHTASAPPLSVYLPGEDGNWILLN